MLVIPAIDIIDGQCVRLRQGNYNDKVIYSADPSLIARQWQSQGARFLHVVDLDGAKKGEIDLAAIKKILDTVTICVQVGGGVRTLQVMEELLDLGVARVILGTVAILQPDLLRQALDLFGPKQIVASLDAKDGQLAVKGWLQSSEQRVETAIEGLIDIGVTRFVFTDITRDGTMQGPNLELASKLIRIYGVKLLVAGGISRGEHISAIQKIGAEGVIIGKALYEGSIGLDNIGEEA